MNTDTYTITGIIIIFFIITVVIFVLSGIIRTIRLRKVSKRFGLSFTRKIKDQQQNNVRSYPKYNVMSGILNDHKIEIFDKFIQYPGHESKSYTKIIIANSERKLEHKKGEATISKIVKIIEELK